MNQAFDVAIVGGGLVGASLAAGLAPSGLRVALIEAAAPPASTPGWDERCIAINHASRQIFAALGVWDALAPEAATIVSTHISEQGRFGVARFSAAEAGLEALGYNLPLRAIGQTLWARMLALGKTQLHCPARLESLEVGDAAVELQLADGGSLSARLLIAADGAGSRVRELLAVGSERRDYAQSAIVTAVRTRRPHRGCAYERFTPDGPIALLPKGREPNRCSLVWTTPAAEVDARMAWRDDVFIAHAEAAFGERLGEFVELGRRQAHPLARVMSDQLRAPRVLFVGNAAQSLHPVAAQGFNLGLRDVAAVIEVLGMPGAELDCGVDELLQRYEASRREDRERVAGFTDRIVRVFSNRLPGLRGLRHLGLLALDLAPPLKQAVMWQNLGLGGSTPALARNGR
ncbi:2-octaprenyl-6-methoxyphenyl hydroxylase [Solimonas terrae]|uniref:2-octaprenyl-6-methoxyphenyl hydroxylase n=1 Tax=Solimonas terrae TaxID=1396819 RepID=A0A6M2BRG5_9GAMM|nr:2-octaprenyl-6-methoxyphenyl hydroxylase [Solimonas terrae]